LKIEGNFKWWEIAVASKNVGGENYVRLKWKQFGLVEYP